MSEDGRDKFRRNLNMCKRLSLAKRKARRNPDERTKDQIREELESSVERFIAGGGRISRVQTGLMTALDDDGNSIF